MLLGQLRSLLRAVGVVLVVLGMDGVNAFSLSPQSTLALRGNWGRSPVSHQLGFACGAPSQRRGTSRSQKFEVMQANPQDSVSVTEVSPLRKYGLGALWVSFIVYGTLFSPAEAPGASLELLKETIKVTDNSVNPIFVALFGSLGVWPAVFSALLLPLKPKDQTLSPTPFLLGSFAAGMGGVTPYLALTRYEQEAEVEGEDSGLAALFGGKATGIFLLVSTIFLGLFGLGVFAPNDLNGGSDYPVDVIFYTYLKNYVPLFTATKIAHVSTIDWFTLWFLSGKPLLEDMKRRGWYKGDALDMGLFASFMLAPVLGACTWLAIRPPLPAPAAKGCAGAGRRLKCLRT